jgi:serine protease
MTPPFLVGCFALKLYLLFFVNSRFSTGTIAAVDNGIGVVGVCPSCNLHIVRVFNNSGLWAYSSTLADAALKCRDAGSNIISMSLGGGDSESVEKRVFDTLLGVNNILSVASAGNDATSQFNYPASYDSVLSVGGGGGLDEQQVLYEGSQLNSQVDLSAPGVQVTSTVAMASALEVLVVAAGGLTYEGATITGSQTNVLQAGLFHCGIADAPCTGATGLICLIQRGSLSFAGKVTNCLAGGGIGAIIYNNRPTFFNAFTLGGPFETTAVAVSDMTGASLLALSPGTVVTVPGDPCEL